MNWRSNKKFSVALLQADVNFQKNGLTVKNQKKIKKNENPNIQKSKKKKSKKKSSKEISVRDHSNYKRYQKKMYAIKCLIVYYKFLWKS